MRPSRSVSPSITISYPLISASTSAGYADPIRQAVHSLENDVPCSGEDHFLLEDSKRAFALALEDLDAAETATLQSMHRAEEAGDQDSVGHHMAFNYCGFCHIAFKRSDWERLAEFAAAGEQTARRIGYKLQISECQMWLALLARDARRRSEGTTIVPASRVPRVAREEASLRGVVQRAYALGIFAKTTCRGALRVRDRELAIIGGHGRLSYECYCHVERCRLLARMGKPLDDVLSAGRSAAARLRNPAPELEKLERVAKAQ